MAEVKKVRLRSVKTGAIVQTTTENAERLSGFEPVESKSTSKSSSSTSKSSSK